MPNMKRIAWVLSILSLSLALRSQLKAELKIDHVTIAGPKLAPMQAGLEKLGIHCEYGGPHANRATEMAIASFPDGSYLELIAFQPKADPESAARHTWTKYMRDAAGPCAWAVRSTDATAEATRLRGAGVQVSSINKSGRVRPDGFRLDWETLQVGTEGNGVFFPFLIHDFTPREKRAFPSGKAGNPDYSGVSKIIIAVSDLTGGIARYRKAYSLPEPRTEQNRAWFAGTPVVLEAQPQRVREFGEGVSGFVLKSNKSGASQSLWFGKKIVWLNPEAIGPNRLAIELK